jgi:hypothetical protein
MTITATDVSMPGTGEITEAVGGVWVRPMTLTFTGSYTTNGDAWAPLTGWPGATPSTIIAIMVTGGAGYDYEFIKASNLLKIYSAAGTELAAGAYPAALTGETVNTVALVYAK